MLTKQDFTNADAMTDALQRFIDHTPNGIPDRFVGQLREAAEGVRCDLTIAVNDALCIGLIASKVGSGPITENESRECAEDLAKIVSRHTQYASE